MEEQTTGARNTLAEHRMNLQTTSCGTKKEWREWGGQNTREQSPHPDNPVHFAKYLTAHAEPARLSAPIITISSRDQFPVPCSPALAPTSSMVDVENVSRDLPAAQDESPSKKAKTAAGGVDAADADAQPSSTKGKFKIVGRVVMAMKRFQASLNPTYSYGKRSSDGGGVVEQTDGHRVLVQPGGRASGTVSGRTTSGRTASGRTLSGRPTSPGQHHGHKGNLLFRPLPELDTTVKSG